MNLRRRSANRAAVTVARAITGCDAGSIGSAAPITLGEAECEGCSELLCTAATPGAVSSAAADAFAAAGFEACCALP